jgi:hypothetical protein
MYALWDEEEQGLVGSAYFANQASAAGDSILGVINLDMIAYDSNNDGKFEIHTRSVGTSLELKDEILDVNATYNIGVVPIIKNPGSTYSDHASFWNRGYGAILLIEDGNDFHPYYHTINDKIQYFNIPYFHKLSKLSIGTLTKLALNLNMTIEHTPIASTNTAGDITTSATVVTGLTIGTGSSAPRLYYRVNTGSGYSDFIVLQEALLNQLLTTLQFRDSSSARQFSITSLLRMPVPIWLLLLLLAEAVIIHPAARLLHNSMLSTLLR